MSFANFRDTLRSRPFTVKYDGGTEPQSGKQAVGERIGKKQL